MKQVLSWYHHYTVLTVFYQSGITDSGKLEKKLQPLIRYLAQYGMARLV